MAYYYDPNQGYYFNPSGASQGTSGGPEGESTPGGDNAYGGFQGSYGNGSAGDGFFAGSNGGAYAYGGGYSYGGFQESGGNENVRSDVQRTNDDSPNAVNRGTTGTSQENGERVSLRGPSGSAGTRSAGGGRSSFGSSGSGTRTSSGSGRGSRPAGGGTSASEHSGNADRRPSAGGKSGSAGNRSGASGGGSANRPRRRKKVTWQRKVKRFFRRLVRTLSRLPQEMLILLAAAVVIAVILIVLIVRALLPSGSRQETSSSSTAVTESDASGESDADGSTEGSEDTSAEDESAEVTTAGLLQGLDNYTLTTGETEISELQSSLTATVPSGYTASSVLTTSSGISYAADNLFDSDLTTSWQEGEDDEGIGVTITSTFASGTELSAIIFWSGNETTEDKFNNNNRPAQITISVSAESQSYSAVYTLEDYMGAQAIVFTEPVPVESVVIRIDSVYEGEVYNDTVISELSFLTQ